MSHTILETNLTCNTALESVAYETFYQDAQAFYAQRRALELSLDKPCSEAFRKLYKSLHDGFVSGWLLEHLEEIKNISQALLDKAKQLEYTP